MRISYDDKSGRHKLDGEGTLILSKCEVGLTVDNVKNFEISNVTIVGNSRKFGRIRQVIKAVKFIYGYGKFKTKVGD